MGMNYWIEITKPKLSFFKTLIRYCIFHVRIFYMAHSRCMESLCNIRSAREYMCVCVCVCVCARARVCVCNLLR